MRKVRMMGAGKAQIILTGQDDGPGDLAWAHGPGPMGPCSSRALGPWARGPCCCMGPWAPAHGPMEPGPWAQARSPGPSS